MKHLTRFTLFVVILFSALGCGSSTPPGGNKDYDRPREAASTTKK